MSTGISIKSASYGAGSSQVDVTATVAAMIKDGVLNVPVTTSALNVTDPAPGQIKTLVVTYTINSGKTNTASEKDNGVIMINAPPQRTASGLQIRKAEYGVPGNFQDVTDAVQNQVNSDGSINLKVGFKEVGLPDPDPTKKKSLLIEYTLNGSVNEGMFQDGERFKLSAPATDAPDGKTASQHVQSFLGTLVANFTIFVLVFLHTMSVFVAIKFGELSGIFISYFWGGLAIFIPMFSFITLPIITCIIRLFKSSDFIVINQLPLKI